MTKNWTVGFDKSSGREKSYRSSSPSGSDPNAKWYNAEPLQRHVASVQLKNLGRDRPVLTKFPDRPDVITDFIYKPNYSAIEPQLHGHVDLGKNILWDENSLFRKPASVAAVDFAFSTSTPKKNTLSDQKAAVSMDKQISREQASKTGYHVTSVKENRFPLRIKYHVVDHRTSTARLGPPKRPTAGGDPGTPSSSSGSTRRGPPTTLHSGSESTYTESEYMKPKVAGSVSMGKQTGRNQMSKSRFFLTMFNESHMDAHFPNRSYGRKNQRRTRNPHEASDGDDFEFSHDTILPEVPV
eukprot:NODE_525_length_1319_cov_291.344882_g377_i0.p1 GENE.NODE_525_length_1319_cov_291.344882_g377_i0~~NODE_525_length_1319_cov_291.344882_g377_i0.p1  ORF type:complete len:297 (-),score=32.32 NODE_525_length_1319_cov_291.344882_g377_i0:353-1243(-)